MDEMVQYLEFALEYSTAEWEVGEDSVQQSW